LEAGAGSVRAMERGIRSVWRQEKKKAEQVGHAKFSAGGIALNERLKRNKSKD